MKRIELITQIDSAYLRYANAIRFNDSPETLYFDPSVNLARKSSGWAGDKWFTICNNFRLEFIYE